MLSQETNGGDVTFTIEFTGDGGAHSFDLQFIDAINAGILYGSVPVTLQTGYVYDVEAIDPDEDVLAYQLVGETHGAQIDPTSGLLTWAPPGIGPYEFTVLVTDGRGGRATQTWTVNVSETGAENTAPAFDPIAPRTFEAERAYTVQLTATDDEGDALWFQMVHDPDNGFPLPSGITIDPQTGRVDWTPTDEQVGTHQIKVRVYDHRGKSGDATLEITVVEPAGFDNGRPVIHSTAPTAGVTGQPYRYAVIATDPDQDRLTFDLPVAPDGMTIGTDSGVLVWQPNRNQAGDHPVVVRVSDGVGGITTQAFTIRVTAVNDPPEITSTPTGPIALNQPWTYQVVATDPNGDELTYRLDEASVGRGMSIDADGLLTWTPPELGDYRVEITADDGRGGTYTQGFTLPVRDNAPPDFDSLPTGPAHVGEEWTYIIVVSDPNPADTPETINVTLDQASIDRGMILEDKVLRWTPRQIGEFAVTLTATDLQGAQRTLTFTLPVRPVVVESIPPKITSQPTGPAYVGVEWTYTLTATDEDSDVSLLVYTLEQPAPEDLSSYPNISFNDPSRTDLPPNTLAWTPTTADLAAGFTFTLRVTDAEGSWTEQTFTVPVAEVQPANREPRITSVPTGPALVNQLYEYQVVAHDPDNDDLVYSIDGASELLGIEIDDQTGLLTWTPEAVGDYPITVTVTDGTAVFQQTFTLPVVAPNHPPEFTSSPQGPAWLGEVWTYRVTASDPEGSDLTYSIAPPQTPYPSTVSWNSDTHELSWDLTSQTSESELTFTVEVSDGQYTVTQTFTLSAVRPNQAPEITSMPTGPAYVDEPWTYQIVATDPDGIRRR